MRIDQVAFEGVATAVLLCTLHAIPTIGLQAKLLLSPVYFLPNFELYSKLSTQELSNIGTSTHTAIAWLGILAFAGPGVVSLTPGTVAQ